MKILILGGTWFIGYHLTNELLKNKHEVWHFNRGNTPTKGVILLKGNRFKGETNSLSGHKFDSIIDLTCFSAQHFSNTYQHLRNNFKQYIFISTNSSTNSELGKDKKEAEHIVQRLSNNIIIRLKNVVGERDYSNRFTKKGNRWISRSNDSSLSISSYVEVEQVAKEITKLIENKTINKIYSINKRVGLQELYQ